MPHTCDGRQPVAQISICHIAVVNLLGTRTPALRAPYSPQNESALHYISYSAIMTYNTQ